MTDAFSRIGSMIMTIAIASLGASCSGKQMRAKAGGSQGPTTGDARPYGGATDSTDGADAADSGAGATGNSGDAGAGDADGGGTGAGTAGNSTGADGGGAAGDGTGGNPASPLRAFNDNVIAAGPGDGGGPHVRGFDSRSNGDTASFFAYGSTERFGARVAVGDVNGDKSTDIITGPGPGGGPHVRILSRSGADIGSFFAYEESLRTGIYVAAGDVDGDGKDEIITGAGEGGGPHVRVFRADGTMIGDFYAYGPTERFGVRVAAGDIDGDGKAEIITAPGNGGGPHIKVFRLDGTEIGSFFAYDPSLRTGSYVAAGDVNGDGHADIVTGAGEGGGPHVRIFSGNGFAELSSFYAYDAGERFGVRVATTDADGDNRAEIITAPGSGGGPHVKLFSEAGAELRSFFSHDAGLRSGIYVGGRPRL